MVLLNDALTCATPDAMFLRSRLRTRVASLPILNPFAARSARLRRRHNNLSHALFFLAGNSLGRSFAGPGVGMSTLAAHGETTAVAQPAIAAKIHQALDVH